MNNEEKAEIIEPTVTAGEMEIHLRPASNETLVGPEFQQSLRRFEQSLRDTGLKPKVRLRSIDAAAGESPAIYSGIFTLGQAALPLLAGVLGVWLKGRAGRKVRLQIGKNGNVKAEAETVDEVKELLRAAKKHLSEVPSTPAKNKARKRSS